MVNSRDISIKIYRGRTPRICEKGSLWDYSTSFFSFYTQFYLYFLRVRDKSFLIRYLTYNESIHNFMSVGSARKR